MKIAFASCINTRYYPDQPVWNNISSHHPDVLVLLGDNVYLDIPWVQVGIIGQVHPADADDNDFLKHGHTLYRELLAQKDFSTFIRSPSLRSFAIWDDHDFLWNNAAGGMITKQVQGEKMRISSALHWQFRQALLNRNPGSFPADIADQRLHNPNETAPGYTCVDLGQDVYLHLTDGRTFRTAHTMFGSTQRDQISDAIQSRANGIHIIASGNVVKSKSGERWEAYPEDYQWLLGMAAQHKLLVLSGDVHENRLPPPIKIAGGPLGWLHEVTSSAAAIGHKLVVSAGKQQHNFGIVDIDVGNSSMSLTLYQGKQGNLQYSRTISLSSWVKLS